jgi:ribosome biogenesis protein BRX1
MTAKTPVNRQKSLVFGSRNMTAKDRHLLQDLRNLMPHSREHAKLNTVDNLGDSLEALCSLHHCNSSLFVEAHRHDIAHVWLAQVPSGPSVKLLLGNVHTADELRMAGNCLKYSRPLLHFDREFEMIPHLRVVKALLQMEFNTPRYHPRSKPFVDHIICFFYLDAHIWFRHYQIVDGRPRSLMEIGPRFTMEPLVILNGAARGSVLWKNPTAVTPTEERKNRKLRQMIKAKENEFVKQKSALHRERYPDPEDDPVQQIFR